MHTPFFESTLTKSLGSGNSSALLAMRDSVAPITFARLRSDEPCGRWTAQTAPETVIAFMVALAPASGLEIRTNDKNSKLNPLSKGHTLILDLSTSRIATLNPPYDFLQFHLPIATMDLLSYDRGMRPIEKLPTVLCIEDPIMHALALSIVPMLANPERTSSAFIDSVAQAFHAHVISTYGSPIKSEYPVRSGLTPAQLRRSQKLIESRLDRDVSITDLAKECRLSRSHFARAFRQATGMPPHKWIIKKRVDRAKELLLESGLELAQIGLACGFFDQSHFTRAFVRQEGYGPGEWRRLRASCGTSTRRSPLNERVNPWTESGSAARTAKFGASHSVSKLAGALV